VIILALPSLIQWRYVPTNENAADVGSRGFRLQSFDHDIVLWLHGPQFQDVESWPTLPTVPQMKDIVLLSDPVSCDPSDVPFSRLVDHYFPLDNPLRVTARILCFMSKKKDVQFCDLKKTLL
jgi:hypothetical protein